MSELLLFSLYDDKVGAYSTPFFFSHRGQAVRAATDLANDPSTIPGKHPEDFTLYCLGTFNDETGMTIPARENLGPLHSFKNGG